jgi:hypothetical protein
MIFFLSVHRLTINQTKFLMYYIKNLKCLKNQFLDFKFSSKYEKVYNAVGNISFIKCIFLIKFEFELKRLLTMYVYIP